jgi:hypothetical protein
MYPDSDTIPLVPAGASRYNSGFLQVRGKIMAGGINEPVAFIQQTTVIFNPLSALQILDTTFFLQSVFFFGVSTYQERKK